MDNVIITLANFGGVGVLAGAVLLLHREALKAFREEMNAERAANSTLWREYLNMKLTHHAEMVRLLGEHSEALSEVRALLTRDTGA